MLLGNETALLRMSHVLLGKIVGGYELGMEALSRSWDAGVDWVMTKGFKSIFPPSQKLLLRSWATSVSALFFMNVCSPSAPAMLPFQRPEQTNTYVKYPLNLGLVISWIQKSKAKYPTIQSLQCQLQSQQIDVALLQDFSVWVCKAALLQFHYAAGKIHPENKSLLVWNGFPVYCDNFLSDSCLAGCPKLTFWIQCEKLYLLWM